MTKQRGKAGSRRSWILVDSPGSRRSRSADTGVVWDAPAAAVAAAQLSMRHVSEESMFPALCVIFFTHCFTLKRYS